MQTGAEVARTFQWQGRVSAVRFDTKNAKDAKTTKTLRLGAAAGSTPEPLVVLAFLVSKSSACGALRLWSPGATHPLVGP